MSTPKQRMEAWMKRNNLKSFTEAFDASSNILCNVLDGYASTGNQCPDLRSEVELWERRCAFFAKKAKEERQEYNQWLDECRY